ncbi:MAG: hypothetical protein PHH84_03240 [Oscillospiraceae bacterium]|nr:hypothetical protein [Oscillospiraceae bacterium]
MSFQLNPPLRVGEISLMADEIPKGMKSAAADRVDLISERS